MSEDKLHILADECVEMTEADFDKALTYFSTREPHALMSAWQSEMIGAWLVETQQERLHRDIAASYRSQCDAFNAIVCSGMRGGEPMPTNGVEMGMIQRNAQRVMNELMVYYNLTQKELHDIIKKDNKR